MFQGPLYRPLTLSKEYLTLPLGSRKGACLSADKTLLQVRKGSSLQASIHSPNRSSLVTKRNTILRAGYATRPGVLKIRKRSRLGRALSNSASTNAFSASDTAFPTGPGLLSANQGLA